MSLAAIIANARARFTRSEFPRQDVHATIWRPHAVPRPAVTLHCYYCGRPVLESEYDLHMLKHRAEIWRDYCAPDALLDDGDETPPSEGV